MGTEEQLAFYKSYDFMKLGQAINREQWQSAAMTLRRMEQNAVKHDIHGLERQFTGLRHCVNRKNKEEAKQILSIVMNKRAAVLNERLQV